jgi:DNA (cytosine-5)-methyltransferase 1
MARSQYAVVDLFAGPGGLAEGFASVGRYFGGNPFKVVLSVEKEVHAHRTLRLRSFLRQFDAELPKEYYAWLRGGGTQPDWESLYPRQWRSACDEALNLTMGQANDDEVLARKLTAIRRHFGDDTIVIGGPPCQAYSLVGRARNRGKADYVFEEDHRHELYKAYVSVLDKLRPAAFVMENVKGLLSSKAHGDLLFHRVLNDLRRAGGRAGGYRLVGLAPSQTATIEPAPSDFIIRAERHGIPQARHRLFIIGLRKDIADRIDEALLQEFQLQEAPEATVGHVLSGMSRLRSAISRCADNPDEWTTEVHSALDRLTGTRLAGRASRNAEFRSVLELSRSKLRSTNHPLPRADRSVGAFPDDCPAELVEWLSDEHLDALPNHETRTHMRADLARYAFAATYAEAFGTSPKADMFPAWLAPDHANWSSGKFADRFKVQAWGGPSSTITSHISKDGHYYIHPDPTQCRSLTVREAARLQTFPDNYVFLGNRTQQYVQVGNAVPPLLASKIAKSLYGLLSAARTSVT